MYVALANSKGCHAPTNTRYSWSSCSSPSQSSKTSTFNLQVTNARTSDSAYWTCSDILLNCNSDPVKTVIQALPGTPQITGFPTDPVTAGLHVNLECVASPPGDTYDWYKGGTQLTTSLTFDFQVKKESTGIYKCVARNTDGSATSRNKTLIVFSKSDSVVVSSGKTSCHMRETDRFSCTATGGSPTPTLKIYIKRPGGTPVEITQSQDRVMAKDDNQAVYYCEAKVVGYPSLDMTSPRKTYNVTYPAPAIKLSLSPRTVNEGDTPSVTCEASGGNPSAYTYHWLYTQKLVQGETSKQYKIKNIQAHQSGSYCCQAVNYSPGGKAEGCTHIDVLYKAKWNPGLPKEFAFTVASGLFRHVKFTLHVIANPSVTGVSWVQPNKKLATDGNFIAAKVNYTTYTLNKAVISFQDYGNYTARVSNSVGMSMFVFELKQAGPPLTPCCQKRENASSVYVTLTFKSNFNGGLIQTSTIEYRKPGAAWRVGVIDIADPGLGQDVIQRVSGLEGSRIYEFRVKAVNDVGTSSYGNIMVVKTQATPNITLTIEHHGNTVTATWSPLKHPYTKVQVKYCPMDAFATCQYHILVDPSEFNARFNVKEGTNYMCSLEVFDGPDNIYQSSPQLPQSPIKDGWAVTAFIVTAIILFGGIVAVAVSIVMYRRSMACFSNKDKSQLQSGGRVGVNGTQLSSPEPVYVNVNRAFNDAPDQEIPPVYVNDGVCQQQVEGTIYDDIRPSQGEENVQGNSGNVEGDTRGMTENPYADLNITPEVIEAQTYAELKPWTYKRNTEA